MNVEKDRVSMSTTFAIHNADGSINTRVLTCMAWHRDQPYWVHTWFYCPDKVKKWIIGRDLLLKGWTRSSGLSDVRVGPSPDRTQVRMTLDAPDGCALLSTPYTVLAPFLRVIFDKVPPGEEYTEDGMDGELAALLSSEEAS